MKVTVNSLTQIATVTMTMDEMQDLRITLDEGAMKLISTASYMKHNRTIPRDHARSAARTARDAKKAADAFEAAIIKWARTPSAYARKPKKKGPKT